MVQDGDVVVDEFVADPLMGWQSMTRNLPWLLVIAAILYMGRGDEGGTVE